MHTLARSSTSSCQVLFDWLALRLHNCKVYDGLNEAEYAVCRFTNAVRCTEQSFINFVAKQRPYRAYVRDTSSEIDPQAASTSRVCMRNTVYRRSCIVHMLEIVPQRHQTSLSKSMRTAELTQEFW